MIFLSTSLLKIKKTTKYEFRINGIERGTALFSKKYMKLIKKLKLLLSLF